MRFHQVHGCNITLSKDNTVATRCQSFANALVFSERPLEPDEVFVFEISDQQDRWAGNLRCGITYHNPEHITVPQYLLPDFMKLGKSFVFAIKPCAEDPFSDKKQDYIETIEKCPDIKFCDHIDKSLFTKTCAKLDIHPCEVGSRIGIFLSPHRELYFIINGIQYGPCTKSIPDHLGVYATADLYGNTKQIKIINYHGMFLIIVLLDFLSFSCKLWVNHIVCTPLFLGSILSAYKPIYRDPFIFY